MALILMSYTWLSKKRKPDTQRNWSIVSHITFEFFHGCFLLIFLCLGLVYD